MKKYFLFGHDIVRKYEYGGIKAAIRGIANGDDFATYSFNANYPDLSDPADLLEAYDGWDAWVEITKEEYMELQKPILER
jgi:hypothetical protein